VVVAHTTAELVVLELQDRATLGVMETVQTVLPLAAEEQVQQLQV
jgi:hypothetical protein